LLKLDIEGAELAVIESVLHDGFLPGTIWVEFHEPAPMADMRRAVGDLPMAGYEPVEVEGWNVTFTRTQ
jgi:hypothetical protein